MEALLWKLSALSGESLTAPLIHSLAILSILCWDYWFLLLVFLWRGVRGQAGRATHPGPLPNAPVVIPSLLRTRDELTSMVSTVRSVAQNGYPSELLIVVSIDGTDDKPELYEALSDWAEAEQLPRGVSLYITGTGVRRGKPMAIEHGFSLVQTLVHSGTQRAFPPVYISTDADADLGAGALENLTVVLECDYILAKLLRFGRPSLLKMIFIRIIRLAGVQRRFPSRKNRDDRGAGRGARAVPRRAGAACQH